MTLRQFIKENNKTHIIFDFDATLFLLVLPWGNWFRDVRHRLEKLDVSIWNAYENKQITIHELQNQYIEKHGEEVRQFLKDYNRKFESRHLQGVSHNHDLLAELDALPASLSFYIWSSNSTETIMSVLEKTNMTHRFEKIITRDDVDFLKPNQAGFNQIYDPEIPKKEYLMVGDSSADRSAAKTADIDFFLINYF